MSIFGQFTRYHDTDNAHYLMSVIQSNCRLYIVTKSLRVSLPLNLLIEMIVFQIHFTEET